MAVDMDGYYFTFKHMIKDQTIDNNLNMLNIDNLRQQQTDVILPADSCEVAVDGNGMTFVRAIDKQPVSAMEYNRVENLQDQEDVSALPAEKYEIRIDSNGIISADWSDCF